jgi:hypothetical protein
MIISDHRSPLASRVLATGHSLLWDEVSSTIVLTFRIKIAGLAVQSRAKWLQFKT